MFTQFKPPISQLGCQSVDESPPPVIMMITAYGDAPSYQQAMQDGANDFLSKPLDFALLREKL